MESLRNLSHRAEGLLGLATLLALALVSWRIIPTLEILLFPSNELSTLGEASAHWASLAAISLCCYFVLGATRFLGCRNGLIVSAQRVISFVFSISWIFFLFVFSVVTSGDIFLTADLYLAIVLASASAASLVWLAVFGGGSFRSALAMFMSTSVVLLVAILFLDDGAVPLVLARLGLVEAPKEALYGSFFVWLPYITPAGPLIWYSLKPLPKPESTLLGTHDS